VPHDEYFLIPPLLVNFLVQKLLADMELAPPHLPRKTSLAIIGAGPHALTLVTYLLQKRSKMIQQARNGGSMTP
jgi:hypothetical protein